MPSVRPNWRLALAVMALAAPALAGPAASRREAPSRAPVSQPISPVMSAPPALQVPGGSQWTAGSAPRGLRSLPETRRPIQPTPLAIPVSGAVALLQVDALPAQSSRPLGFTALLEIDEVHPALLQRQSPKAAAVLLERDAPAIQVLAPGESR